MFSSLRNYSKNIGQCERFYYDNYDYYNIYQNLQTQYKDDLSKFIYNCNRRSTPYIVTYGTLFKTKHSRLIKNTNQAMMEEENEEIQKSNGYKYMQEFINGFIKIYMENNYFSLIKNNQKQSFVEPFQLLYFSTLNDTKYESICPFKIRQLETDQLTLCLSQLVNAILGRIQHLEQQWSQVSNQEYVGSGRLSAVQFNFALELYSKKVLQEIYQEGTDNFVQLLQFIKEVQRIMWEIMNGRMRTILLMAQPKTYHLNFIIHPLILPITTFLNYEHQKIPEQSKTKFPSLYHLISSSEQPKPRIVFLNLDGKETAHNLRTISTLGKSLLYISLYSQPSWIEKGQTNLKNVFPSDEEGFQVNYRNLWNLYSQQIAKEYNQIQGSSTAKILLFPLYSAYVIRKYMQRKIEKNENVDLNQSTYQKLPKIQLSNDIHSLFEHIIFQQIRMFKPTMIFISYNGQINILEDHFSDIVRNCSIIADHRVILFTNFTHYFQDEMLQANQEEQQIQKIMCSHQFYQTYFNYEFQNINQERLYTNLSLFLKYASGIYSMEDRTYGTPSMKYNIQKLYLYLNSLSQMSEFKKIQNNVIRKWQPEQLSSLYQSYRRWEIRQNKKESKYYQNLLSTVIAEFLCKTISKDQLIKILDKRLFYRYQYLIEQLLREQNEFKLAKQKFFSVELNEQQFLNYFQSYLEMEKQKLLVTNFQNYKIKKHFHLCEAQKSFGQVSCFKFLLQDGKQGEQISLEKYSQVIINEESEELFIINYKNQENRHMILYGNMKNSQIQKQIPVYEVKETDQELNEVAQSSIQHMYLSEEGLVCQKQDIVFVQYNYCINHRSLYIFWPLMWNLKEEARCKLLGIQYRAKRFWKKMIKISYFSTEVSFKFQNLQYEPDRNGIEILPRWGCSSYFVGDNSFLIFGGIYDNQDDFKKIGVGIYRAQIKGDGNNKMFTIVGQSKNQNGIILPCIKPKINYAIKKSEEKAEQNIYKILGGYGRENTGFFNIFSHEQYEYDLRLGLKKINNDKISNRRIVATQKPLQNDRIGKFNVTNGYNIIHVEQKFSDSLKDKFVFEKGVQKTNKLGTDWELLAFIDQTYRVNQFKTDPKKLFLFGYDRTVREKIYLKCWSPELYILDGIKQYIINLSLKTEKSTFIITNYIMPREQDIVSLCLEEDRIYLLSNSPIIHSIDRPGLKYALYEGSLTNINEVMRRREVQMTNIQNFEERYQKFLNEKSIFLENEKIYLVGGRSIMQETMESKYRFQRQDYILQANKNKFKIKTRKVQCEHSNLQMPNSVIIKEGENFFIYSITYQDLPTQTDQSEGIQWKIKIEKNTFENSQTNRVTIGAFKTYAHINNVESKIQRYPHGNIDQPKFVRILPYKRFSFQAIRQVISKIMWKIDRASGMGQKKLAELETIKKLNLETNDQQLIKQLQMKWNQYQQVPYNSKNRSEISVEVNFQQEQILKDLKHLYELVTKMILQKHMCLGEVQPNQHMFIVQDKTSKKVKYISVGPLNTTKLNFFRIRFKNQLFTNINQHSDQSVFYHPTISGYYKFQNENLKSGVDAEYSSQEIVLPLKVTIKQ